MKYEIMEQRLKSVLQHDKCGDVEHVCEILKSEISPIVASFIELKSNLNVRVRRENSGLVFSIEFDALRVRSCGYLPKF